MTKRLIALVLSLALCFSLAVPTVGAIPAEEIEGLTLTYNQTAKSFTVTANEAGTETLGGKTGLTYGGTLVARTRDSQNDWTTVKVASITVAETEPLATITVPTTYTDAGIAGYEFRYVTASIDGTVLYAAWPKTFTVSVTTNDDAVPSAGTAVAEVPGSIIADDDELNPGTEVTLTATPATNYQFIKWEFDPELAGNASEDDVWETEYSFNVLASESVTAHFAQVLTGLTAGFNENGKVEVNPAVELKEDTETLYVKAITVGEADAAETFAAIDPATMSGWTEYTEALTVDGEDTILAAVVTTDEETSTQTLTWVGQTEINAYVPPQSYVITKLVLSNAEEPAFSEIWAYLSNEEEPEPDATNQTETLEDALTATLDDGKITVTANALDAGTDDEKAVVFVYEGGDGSAHTPNVTVATELAKAGVINGVEVDPLTQKTLTFNWVTTYEVLRYAKSTAGEYLSYEVAGQDETELTDEEAQYKVLDVSFADGLALTEDDAPTVDGYTFVGWTVDGGEVVEIEGGEQLVLTANTTAEDVWGFGETIALTANYTQDITPNAQYEYGSNTKYALVSPTVTSGTKVYVKTFAKEEAAEAGIADAINANLKINVGSGSTAWKAAAESNTTTAANQYVAVIVTDNSGLVLQTGCAAIKPAKAYTLTDTTASDANGTLTYLVGGTKKDLNDESKITDIADGATVKIGAEPALGYELKTLTVDGSGVALNDDGSYEFKMAKGVTVAATFAPIDYTVTWNVNGTRTEQKYTIANVSSIDDPETDRDNYTFIGWTGTDLDEPVKTVNIPVGSIGDREYTANYTPIEYKLTYNLVGEAEIKGVPATRLPNPETATVESAFTLYNASVAGYTFQGWTIASGDDPTKDLEIEAGEITGDTTFMANWQANSYTVAAADTENGTITEEGNTVYNTEKTITVTPNGSYKLSKLAIYKTDATKDSGYDTTKAIAWTKAVGENQYTFTMPAYDVTVVATFANTFATVAKGAVAEGKEAAYSILVNGTAVAGDGNNAAAGAKVTLKPDSGKMFEAAPTVSGLSVVSNGDGTYSFTVPANATGESVYTVNATTTVKQYAITLRQTLNGETTSVKNATLKVTKASGAVATTAAKDDTLTVTASALEGYALGTISWSGGGSNGSVVDGGSFKMPEGNVTVTVALTATDYEVKSTEIANGSITSVETAKKGETVTLTAAPNNGYQLKANTLKVAYKDDGTKTVAVTEKNGAYSFTMPAANVTVSAEFEPCTYTISYKDATVQASAPKNYTFGTGLTAEAIPAPTKTGYVFQGWSVSVQPSGGTATVADSELTVQDNAYGNITLTANWIPDASSSAVTTVTIQDPDNSDDHTTSAKITIEEGKITIRAPRQYANDLVSCTYTNSDLVKLYIGNGEVTAPQALSKLDNKTLTLKNLGGTTLNSYKVSVVLTNAAAYDDADGVVSAQFTDADGNVLNGDDLVRGQKVYLAVETDPDYLIAGYAAKDTEDNQTVAITETASGSRYFTMPAKDVTVTVSTVLAKVEAGEPAISVANPNDEQLLEAAAIIADISAPVGNAETPGLLNAVTDSTAAAGKAADVATLLENEDYKQNIKEALDLAENNEPVTVVEPYLNVTVNSYTPGDKMKIVIQPMYRIALSNGLEGDDKKSVPVEGMTGKLTVGQSGEDDNQDMEINIPLPAGFLDGEQYIKHTPSAGANKNKNVIYSGTVKNSILTFITPNGCSPFEIGVIPMAKIVDEETGEEALYETVTEAINDAESNGKVTLTADGTAAAESEEGLDETESGQKLNNATKSVTVEDNAGEPVGDGKITVSNSSGKPVTISDSKISTTYQGGVGGGGGGGGAVANVTVAKAANGSVKVSNTSANAGDKVTVTLTPNSGYEADTLTVKDKNGKEITATKAADGTYTFTMPASSSFPVTVTATFKAAAAQGTGFIDVPADSWYAAAVDWAVNHDPQITNGKDAVNTFKPNDICTRAEAVTFLYRAVGAPDVALSDRFTDVSADAYYAKAVAWAVANGVTNGKDAADTFCPTDTCTRAEIMTMIARFEKAAAGDASRFIDVDASDWFAGSVGWAVGKGITNGKDAENTFKPADSCTRAEIVTFLYRDMVK